MPLILLSAQLPLWVLKLITGGHIVRVDAKTGQTPPVQQQFGIGHLMGATVVVALAFGLASSGMRLMYAGEAMGRVEGMAGMERMIWGAMVAYGMFLCFSTLFVTMPCLWAGLGAKSLRAGAVGLAIYAGVIFLLWLGIVALFDSGSIGSMSGEAILMMFLFPGSLVFVTLGTLYVARFYGYRYQRGGRPQPIVRTGSPFAATGSPFAAGHEVLAGTQEAQRPIDGSPAEQGDGV